MSALPLSKSLRQTLKFFAKRCGYEVLKHPRAYAAQRSLKNLLDQERINLVLDVGANKGQFAQDLRAAGYTARIVSFEPQADAYEHLLKAAATDPSWTVAQRTALGACTGSMEMHLSANSESSSLLPMLETHVEAAPDSIYEAIEVVPIHRLDDLWHATPDDRVLLKIDVQGYEKPVLDGAIEALRSCRAVMTEMSLLPLYDGQILAQEMWIFLDKQGFEAWSLEPGFRHPKTARMLQCDGTFVRVRE